MQNPTERPTRRNRLPRRGDDGYVMMMFALMIVPLMAFAALGVDVGSWYARGAQLQKAADSAALAGVVWMPELATAQSVADTALEQNGITPGGKISVSIHAGDVANSLEVQVTDDDVKPYFSGLFIPDISITRSATAQYVLPVPLGSPQNFFGGVAKDPSGHALPNIGSNTPGFWANIHGPYSNSTKGDAFSTLCYGSDNCSTPNNYPDYRSTGYQYEVVAPPNPGGPITVSVYDGGYYPQSNEQTGTSDYEYGVANQNDPGDKNGTKEINSNFDTLFTMYSADSTPLNINDNPPMDAIDCGGTTGNNPNSGAWDLSMNQDKTSFDDGASGGFYDRWVALCTIEDPVPNGVYPIRVQTTTINGATVGAGANRYALQATASAGTEPTISAYSDMSIYTNPNAGSANFYAAQVGPMYAGKTLDVDLYDPGDVSSGNAYMSVIDPTTGNPAASCTYQVVNPLSGKVTKTGTLSPCTIQTATNGTVNFNGLWVDVSINLPSSYTCDTTKPGGYSVGGCWWSITYNFSGTGNDTTTWKVDVEGNPVHLIQ